MLFSLFSSKPLKNQVDLNKELNKYIILFWSLVILFSLTILVMLEINERNNHKYEKYNQFIDYFTDNYYGFDQKYVDSLTSKDEFWIGAILNQVNAQESDEMIKKYNSFLSKERAEKTDEYSNLFKSEVVGKKLTDDVFYIKFDMFGDSTFNDLQTHSKQITSDMTLIIDLSNNPGGDIKVLNDVLGLFINKNKNMYYIQKRGETSPVINSNTPLIAAKKIRIIVSNTTASAAEILTLSLKSNFNNVTVLGKTTRGKGIQVSSQKFNDGSVIRFVSGIIYGPNMELLHTKGIIPDKEIEIKYDETTHTTVSKEESARILDIVLRSHP